MIHRPGVTSCVIALAALASGVASSNPTRTSTKNPTRREPGGSGSAEPAAAPPAAKPAPAAKSPPPRAGDPRRIVGILEVQVDGVAAEIAAQFQSGLEAQVDTKHYWLAPRARMHELLANSTKWTEGCVIGQCLGEVKTQTGADLVLLAALNGSGTSFGYVVTLVRTDIGRVLAQRSERCDVCTVNEALTAATLATVELLNAVPDKLPDDAAENHAALDLAVRPLHARIDHAHHDQRVLGATLTIAGLAAAAAGTALYFTQAHARYAVATAAAGGGVALGGVLVLTF